MSTSKSLVPVSEEVKSLAASLDFDEFETRTTTVLEQGGGIFKKVFQLGERQLVGVPFVILEAGHACEIPERRGERRDGSGEFIIAKHDGWQCYISIADLETRTWSQPMLAVFDRKAVLDSLSEWTPRNYVRSIRFTIWRSLGKNAYIIVPFDPTIHAAEDSDEETYTPAVVASHPTQNGTNGAKRGPGRPSKQLTNAQLLAKQQALATVKNGASITDVTSLWSND